MIEKVENTTFLRDNKSGSISNTDISGYKARKKVITRNKTQDNRIDVLESHIADLMAKLEHLTGEKLWQLF